MNKKETRKIIENAKTIGITACAKEGILYFWVIWNRWCRNQNVGLDLQTSWCDVNNSTHNKRPERQVDVVTIGHFAVDHARRQPGVDVDNFCSFILNSVSYCSFDLSIYSSFKRNNGNFTVKFISRFTTWKPERSTENTMCK